LQAILPALNEKLKIIIFLKSQLCNYTIMTTDGNSIRLFRTVSAVIIITLLITAAVIKIIYSSPLLSGFYFMISVFEVALALGVGIFSTRWQMWALLALVFATWGGYSLYAAVFGLPCMCLGVAVTLPHGTSLIANILLAALSWVVLKNFGISRQTVTKLALLSVLLVGLGFACASFLYYIMLK
jgi:hypothetical protein